MAQNVGQSRGSTKHKQFVQDSANSYIVDAFQDMSEVAPLSPVDGEGYIVENVGSIDGSWGTITGLANGDIIRYRASKAQWQIVAKAVVANQGFKAYVKDEDILYVIDAGAEWIVASGSGGGVKNFAQRQAGAYKPGDWIQGNSGTFGAGGTIAGTVSVETAAPLDGKKSFKYETAAGSGNDWFYLLVDIDAYARGGVIAFTFDYTWDGDEDILVQVWDPTLTTQYSTELNLVKNTTNGNKGSRNSRTIYAHPDTESQVIVGFQINSAEVTAKTFIWDNLAVTDNIGVIGSSASTIDVGARVRNLGNSSIPAGSTYFMAWDLQDYDHVGMIKQLGGGFDTTSGFDGGLGTYAEIQEDGLYHVRARVHFEDADLDNEEQIRMFIFKDYNNGSGSTLAETIYEGKASSGSAWYFDMYVEGTFELKKGEIIEIAFNHNAGANLSTTNTNVTNDFTITKVGAQVDGGRFLQVPNGEKLEDEFSVILDTGGNIVSQSGGDWIDSITFANAGDMTVNFKAGIFTQRPLVEVTVDGFERISAFAQNVSTSTARIRQFRTDTGSFGTGYNYLHVKATKQGADQPADIVGVPVSIQGQTHEQDSYFRCIGVLGSASYTARYNTPHESGGSAMTFVDSPTEGTSVVINESGTYSFTATVGTGSINTRIGFVKNSAFNEAVNFGGQDTRILTQTEFNQPPTDLDELNISWQGYLFKGDVVRIKTSSAGAFNAINATNRLFSGSKIGTQPLLDGGVVITDEDSVQNTYSASLTNNTTTQTIESQSHNFIQSVSGGLGVINVTFVPGFFTETPVAVANTKTANRIANITSISTNTVQIQTEDSSGADLSEPVQLIVTRQGNDVKKLSSAISANTSRVYKEDPIAYQIKYMSDTSFSPGTTATIPGLEFNNLEIDKTYRVTFAGSIVSGDGAMEIRHNNVTIAEIRSRVNTRDDKGGSIIFTATTNTLSARFNVAGGTIYGDATPKQTYVQLEELPFHTATSKWT